MPWIVGRKADGRDEGDQRRDDPENGNWKSRNERLEANPFYLVSNFDSITDPRQNCPCLSMSRGCGQSFHKFLMTIIINIGKVFIELIFDKADGGEWEINIIFRSSVKLPGTKRPTNPLSNHHRSAQSSRARRRRPPGQDD